jgi:N-acetyl-gamma-glutamyl-phosphate reductase
MNGYSIPVGVLGASGYSGRELVTLLAHHPRVRIAFASSESEAGGSLREISGAAPDLALVRAGDAPLGEVEVVFLCLPHGESMGWAERARGLGVRVIDLSADLRVPTQESAEWSRGAVYGLPELHREALRGSELVANPGCYPTAALLALAPLLRRGLAAGPVVISAASGVTGAGRSPRRELLFAEVFNDFRAYATGNTHRHLREIRHQADRLASGGAPDLVFTPHLLPVQRGILETIHVPLNAPAEWGAAAAPWLEDYATEPFVQVMTDRVPSLRDVVGTNRVAIGVAQVTGVTTPMLEIVCAIDNLRKGAAGQALQNCNLMFGWRETEGLL